MEEELSMRELELEDDAIKEKGTAKTRKYGTPKNNKKGDTK